MPLSAQQKAPTFNPNGDQEQIDGQPAGMSHEAWLKAMRDWREKAKKRLDYHGDIYERPELKWSQRNFAQPQMMVEDRYFYDPATQKYTVDKYLDDLEARYGGIDSVLAWPVYPNVGVDNRNQQDLLEDMPGGFAGLKQMIADFHRRGVHVLFPMMPWENQAHKEKRSLAEATAENFNQAGIDGVNGDTMGSIGLEYLKATDALHHSLAFEAEGGCSNLADVQYDVLGWGYWNCDPIPHIDRYKWLDPRHLTHVCDRWQKKKINMLQVAYFNGDGFETWENVWGIWNGITPRDGAALRRLTTVERFLSEYLVSPDWEPHFPMPQPDVYASRFPLPGRTAWLIVNRSKVEKVGAQMSVPAEPGVSYYDGWNGRQLQPTLQKGQATLSFRLEANGFGCVVALSRPPSEPFNQFLARMADLTAKDLSTFSDEWTPLPQTCVTIPPTAPATSAPKGMIRIPGTDFDFKVHGVEMEGWGPLPAANLPGVDVQYPGEKIPLLLHELKIPIKSFYIDKYPVTNADFKKFLDASHYHPGDDHHFLKDWKGNQFPSGWARKPVTWVSLEDARAYAAWAGKRLPHEWEWQYAAQGTDGRPYPWGQAPDASAIPHAEKGPDLRGPTDVDAYPRGASPFGVMDLTNNVWQWTDEFQDEHTRAAILRGGSYYRPTGSGWSWYFPLNRKLDEHGKFLLMCPGKDRSGTIGFRCVQDL